MATKLQVSLEQFPYFITQLILNTATSTNGRLCRSGGVKSYASDCSAGEKSSPSDSDWAVDKEQQKKAQQTTDQNIAVNHGEDDEASSKADPPSPP